jgi:sulfur-carrier protein adenylyltransferase/sulfurtransferase
MESKLLSNQELRRYRRQIMLPGMGIPGQEKLKSAKVIVIGAGGIGTSVLQYLAISGVGELGICDNTIIKEENFQNQILYNSLDLGKQKAIISKQKLEILNSFNHYSIYNIFISSENVAKICKEFEIVIDATNNKEIGLLLDDVCYNGQIPLVYSDKTRNGFRISVFNYNNGPRLVNFIDSTENDQLNFNNNSETGSFGVVEGIIGNIMAAEVIKIITGFGKVISNEFLSINTMELRIEYKCI